MCPQLKVRCEKRSPCTNCLKHGSSCTVVERRYWPRGRSGKQASGRHRELPNDEQVLRGYSQQKWGITGRPNTGEKASKSQHLNLREPSWAITDGRKSESSPTTLLLLSPR